LIEVRAGRQLSLHDELPFALRLMSAGKGRKKVRNLRRIVQMSGLSPFRGRVAPQTHGDRISCREAKAIARIKTLLPLPLARTKSLRPETPLRV
jgi:hypothetical protein